MTYGMEPNYNPATTVSRIDVLRRQIEHNLKRAEEAQNQIDQVERFGEDDWEMGTVLRFDKQFVSGGTVYSYVMIKCPSRLRQGGGWYSSGPRAPKDFSWEDMIAWIQEGPNSNVELWVVSEYSPIENYL